MSVSPANPSGTTSAANSAQSAAQGIGTDPAALALRKVGARIQQQLETTGAQLSSLGKLKSAVSDVQMSAQNMSVLAASPATSATDIKVAANHFVMTFNASLAASKTATASLAASATAGALGPRQVGQILIQGINADPVLLATLHKAAGFKQLDDGALKMDLSKLDAALKADPAGVQDALGKLGQITVGTAAQELTASDHIATPWAALSQRATDLKTQIGTLLKDGPLANAATSPLSASYVNNSIAAYKSGN